MTWDGAATVAGAVCLALGATLSLMAALGLARFPDLLARMHAATKPQVLGLCLMMAGLALTVREGVVGWTLLLVVAFQVVTAPVSAHMVARAAYRTGKVGDEFVVDEFTRDLDQTQESRPPSGHGPPST